MPPLAVVRYRPPFPRPPAAAAPAAAAATTKQVFCHNCGDVTHTSNRCELPIMSYGAIAYRYRPDDGRREFLMICRRHSFGYLDFMRGRLPRIVHEDNSLLLQPHPHHPIGTMIAQMTRHERAHLVAMARDPEHAAEIHQSFGPHPFPNTPTSNAAARVAAWIQNHAVGAAGAGAAGAGAAGAASSDRQEEDVVHVLEKMVRYADSVQQWDQPEWGFPKGKRNTLETDRACALREFSEETGMPARMFAAVSVPPGVPDSDPWPQEQRCASNRMGRAVRETFRGTNGKRYAHRYLLLAPQTREAANFSMAHFQKWEVSDMRWFTLEDACAHIRPYNHEKRTMLERLDAALDAKKRAVAAMTAEKMAVVPG